MPYRDVKTLEPQGQIQFRPARRPTKLLGVFQCLVVSADDQRRTSFEHAAREGGWKTFPCGDAATALSIVNRSLVQLAIVDLEGQRAEAFRPLVQRLGSGKGLLLIVCGNEGMVEEEIWVRQLGAWLYLPAADSEHFTSLCSEALHIVERLNRPSGTERQASSSVRQHERYS